MAVLLAGFDFSNPTRVVWEAAAAVPFTAFCAAAEHPIGDQRRTRSGYRVMGHPGRGAARLPATSHYGRKLASERTEKGYLA